MHSAQEPPMLLSLRKQAETETRGVCASNRGDSSYDWASEVTCQLGRMIRLIVMAAENGEGSYDAQHFNFQLPAQQINLEE